MLTKGLARDIPGGRFDRVVYQEILRAQRRQQRLAPERPAWAYASAYRTKSYDVTVPGSAGHRSAGLISRVRRSLRR